MIISADEGVLTLEEKVFMEECGQSSASVTALTPNRMTRTR